MEIKKLEQFHVVAIYSVNNENYGYRFVSGCYDYYFDLIIKQIIRRNRSLRMTLLKFRYEEFKNSRIQV